MTIEQVIQLIQLGQVPIQEGGQWDRDMHMMTEANTKILTNGTPPPVEVSRQWDDVPGPSVQNQSVKSDRTKPEELGNAIKSCRCRNC